MILATPHKVGSTQVFNLLTSLGLSNGTPHLDRAFTETDTLVLSGPSLRAIRALPGRWVFKSHSPPPHDFTPEDMRSLRFLTVLRAPWNVLVSASRHHLAWLTPALGGWGEVFRALETKERIAVLIDRGEFLLSSMERWSSCPFAHIIRYEHLKKEPVPMLDRVLSRFAQIGPHMARPRKTCLAHCGLDFPEETVVATVGKNDFSALSGRQPGIERPDAFLHKGIVGDWRSVFDTDTVARFKFARDGRWQKLVLTLDYETDSAWAVSAQMGKATQ